MSKERRILLVRHGIAQPRGSVREENRELTKSGRQRMKAIARGLSRLVPEIDAIYSSPLVRCLQTAEYLAEIYEVEVQIADELRPDADASKILKRAKGTNIALVGHEPSLSAMMFELTGMTAAEPPELKKGGCYALRMIGGNARLEWMLPPKIFV